MGLPEVKVENNAAEPSFLKKLGPGLITGAADDDPSGIATYSPGWRAIRLQYLVDPVLHLPLMVAIQVISAKIGRVTGRGLATNMRRHYPGWLLYGIVSRW